MNRRPVLTSAAELLTVLLIVALLPTSAHAQPGPRDFGVFADAFGETSSVEVGAFEPFNTYIIGFELDGEVKGYDFGLHLPPEFTMLSITVWPSGPFMLWQLPDIRRGTGGCFPGVPSYLLMIVNLGYFGSESVPQDALMCLGPHSDPDPILNGRPGYLQCDGDWTPLGYAQNGGPHYPDGCLVINPTHPNEPPVATAPTTFGAIKARFQDP